MYNKITDSTGKTFKPCGFKLNPNAEFFIADMFALGITTSFSYTNLGKDNVYAIAVGPIFSFYYNKTYPIIPFVSIFGMYGHENTYRAIDKSMYWTDQAMIAGVKAGAVYMISRQVGVFFDLRFTYEKHYEQDYIAGAIRYNLTGWSVESFVGFKYFIF